MLKVPETPPTDDSRVPDTRPLAGCLVRVGWMVAGNAALLMVAVTIMQEPPWTLTVKDALFWTIVMAVVMLRYVDVARLHGRTADGAPARSQHVLRHAVGLIALSVLLWTIVQAVHVTA